MITSDSDKEDNSAVKNLILEKKIDGIILPVSAATEELIDLLLGNHFPFIVLGEPDNVRDGIHWIDMDNKQGAEDAVNYLHRMGYEKTILLVENRITMFERKRIQGFQAAIYERVTRMHIYERTPYAGQLVFAAFSGSHQDAIAKGMAYRKERGEHRWTCPYIPIDPHDIGRTYDADVIRINSQSGKGGIGFVLEQNYGYNLPPKMREVLGYKVKSVSDHSHKELSAGEVLRIFEESFLNREKPLRVVEAHFAQVNGITATVTLDLNGQRKVVTSVGNGRLDAVANAIQSATGMDFQSGKLLQQ